MPRMVMIHSALIPEASGGRSAVRILLSRLSVILLLHCGAALADYDHGMRYVFVAGAGAKSVSIIDLHDQRLAETITLADIPGDIAASDRLDLLVIAYPERKKLGLIDLSSARLKQEFIDLALVPDYLKLDPAGDKIAIYDQERRRLEIHHLHRPRMLAFIEDVNTAAPLTFNRDGQSVFWVDAGQGRLFGGDLRGQITSVKLADHGAGLSAMTRSVDGSMGFVSDAQAGKVYVIRLRDMALLKEVPVGRGPVRAWGTADGQSMLVPNQGDGTLTAISTFTLDPMYTVDTRVDAAAVYSGWLDTTAAVVGATGKTALVNLTTRSIIKSLTLHGAPQSGVVSSDSRLLTLPVAGHGDLYLIDMRSLSVAKRITGLPDDLGDASLAVSNNLCH